MNINEADVICFDADNTLIKYSTKDFVKLQYISLAKCMIKLGAPAELLTIVNPDDIYRIGSSSGVIADFHTGHLLKIASDGTILRAHFGLEESKNLEELYGSPPKYHLQEFDKYYVPGERHIYFTHFAIGGSALWQTCVELIKQGKYHVENFVQLSEFMREAIHMNYLNEDRSHSEYYSEFYDHPELYLVKASQEFKDKLQGLRSKGKKLVLVTNSYSGYTQFIFGYSYGSDWHSYFDAYVFAAGKPDFFIKNDDLEIIEHMELNGDVYQKGSARHLKESVGGHKYVFVGDHYIGDIYSPKQNSWATIALVEELHYEKSLTGPASIQQIEEAPYCISLNDPLDYFQTWGSHFKDENERTYWWQFIIDHSDGIIPTLESIFDLFTI